MMPARRHADARCGPRPYGTCQPWFAGPSGQGRAEFPAREGYLTFTVYDSNLASMTATGRPKPRTLLTNARCAHATLRLPSTPPTRSSP
jgi:hypothetical protein